MEFLLSPDGLTEEDRDMEESDEDDEPKFKPEDEKFSKVFSNIKLDQETINPYLNLEF